VPTDASARPEATDAARVDKKAWLGLGVLLAGAFMATLDTFIVNVAVPSIRIELHATFADSELIIAGYTLTYAIGLVTGGRLGDVYGRRRLFSVGLGGFTLASAVCAVAPAPAVLIVGRLLQGVGAALLAPQVLAIIRVTFPAGRERARAFATMGVVLGLASVLGQLVGGLVLQADLWGLAWRPVFLINVPIGAAALIATPLLVRESRAERMSRLDGFGIALSTVGMFLLVFPLIEAPSDGWPHWSLAMLGASGVVLAAFIADQARKSRKGRMPLLDTRLFAERSFSIGAAAVFAFSATMPPLYLAFTILAQSGYGASALTAGLLFAPLALTYSVAAFTAGRLASSRSHGILVTGAVLNVAGACAAVVICLAAPGDVPELLMPALMVIGAGSGLFQTPIFNAALSKVADHHVGTASGALSTMQRLGNAVGLAVLEIPFLVSYEDFRNGGASPAVAYTHAFAAVSGAVAASGTIVIVLLLRMPARRGQPDAIIRSVRAMPGARLLGENGIVVAHGEQHQPEVTLSVGNSTRVLIGRSAFRTVLAAAVFFVFTASKEVKGIYIHAPWVNDPYDTLFSFTMFFVPIVTAFFLVQVSLCRKSEPLPTVRVEAILRGCRIAVGAMAIELLSAWSAVLLGANHAEWSVGATGPLLVLLVVASVMTARVISSLRGVPPLEALSQEDRAQAPDWLGDFVSVARRESRWLGPFRHFAVSVLDSTERGLAHRIRRHPLGSAAAASGLFAVIVFGWQAIREGYAASATLLSLGLGFCGMYAFLVIAGSYLSVVRSPSPLFGVPRRVVDASVTACVAAVASLAFRDDLWWVVGSNPTAAGAAQFAFLVTGVALVAFVVALTIETFLRSHAAVR